MIRGLFQAVRDVIVPRLCFACFASIDSGVLCGQCLRRIVAVPQPCCRYCAGPVSSGTVCGSCRKLSHPYDRLLAAAAYREPLIGLIHRFKYRQCDFLAGFFAGIMAGYLHRTGFNPASYDLVTAVPIARGKLKMRGYNQSFLLARHLSKYINITVKNDIITAVYERPSQTTLIKHARSTNVEGVFRSNDEACGKRIILIDDIVTTTATVRSCCAVLKEKGARNITVLTLARA